MCLSVSALALASGWTCLFADKEENDQLFETMDANDLNKRMKDFMPDLSVKVFRWAWAPPRAAGRLLHRN